MGARGAGGEGLFGELDSELVEDRIYALTPKGEVVDLPLGATPITPSASTRRPRGTDHERSSATTSTTISGSPITTLITRSSW
jgi:hypothetical protein